MISEMKVWMLNKPKGYVTARFDDRGRKSVYDLLPKGIDQWVFPVGRLDRMSEGLLLFTSEGQLGNVLTDPRQGVWKVYNVSVEGHSLISSSDGSR
mmetsp:Transcript_17851/g.33813  ORF Transcript_17851/g.33813 Transcript_17851/m.33813 type:complete len:96 (-) Transcript_17851:616-903(-)